MKIHLIAAARPNFMKIAPLYRVLRAAEWARPVLVHTGQHYDANMSEAFFTDLQLPAADFHLGVGSGSHAAQTAAVMQAYEQVCERSRPDWIVVVGDVNSTMACAIVGAKAWIPVAHLEAGLRSRDRRMPEEINRLVTDALADLLWTPSADASENLRREGIADAKIELVGNIMIDSYEMLKPQIEADNARARLGLSQGGYGVITLHRPSNVDDPKVLRQVLEQLAQASRRLPLVFPVHPRTRRRIEEFGLAPLLEGTQVRLLEPLSYVPFMNLVSGARLVLTDSGGLQEETTHLGIPCLTLRDTTERPITLSQGTNRLVTPAVLLETLGKALDGPWPKGRRPALWDGHTAERVVASLAARRG